MLPCSFLFFSPAAVHVSCTTTCFPHSLIWHPSQPLCPDVLLFPLVRPSTTQENVVNLNHSHFLRLNGARNIGIRTSFGVPVVSRWGVTFVIVFYSRAAVQVCMRRVCARRRVLVC